MAKFTNKTPRTPLAVGALGLLLEPGETATVSVADMHRAAESPVVQAWVKSGMLEVSPDDGDNAEAARLLAEQEAEAQRQREAEEAEELRKLEEAEAEAQRQREAEAAKLQPPKVPTPAPRK